MNLQTTDLQYPIGKFALEGEVTLTGPPRGSTTSRHCRATSGEPSLP